MTTCNPDQLRLLLADQLPQDQQAAWTDHLSSCQNCRVALESLAGDAGWWSEVETCLRHQTTSSANEATSELIQNDLAASLDQLLLGDASHPSEAFAADFIVDFLEPCDQPDSLGRLGEYEIQELIGRGGMGVVLKGFHRELGRYVAVKVMAPHLASSGAARQRFVREARAAAAIVHPHVMPIHAVCTTARLPYLVMPYVACESLQQRIDRQGMLEPRETLRIGLQVAEGLAAAHAQGLIHRDIKPANILLEKGVDRVMLTDFGLARAVDDASLTRTGAVAGTPMYMSPEQSQGEPLDARSDLFSLGSVLYTMCAGHPPFRAETILAVLRRISDSQPRPLQQVNPDTPAWLEKVVMRLHEKRPADRYADAGSVAELLERCLAHLQQPTMMPLPLELQTPVAAHPKMWRLRNVVLAACVMLSVGVGVGVWYQQQKQPVSVQQEESRPMDPKVLEALSDRMTDQEASQINQDLQALEQTNDGPW